MACTIQISENIQMKRRFLAWCCYIFNNVVIIEHKCIQAIQYGGSRDVNYGFDDTVYQWTKLFHIDCIRIMNMLTEKEKSGQTLRSYILVPSSMMSYL